MERGVIMNSEQGADASHNLEKGCGGRGGGCRCGQTSVQDITGGAAGPGCRSPLQPRAQQLYRQLQLCGASSQIPCPAPPWPAALLANACDPLSVFPILPPMHPTPRPNLCLPPFPFHPPQRPGAECAGRCRHRQGLAIRPAGHAGHRRGVRRAHWQDHAGGVEVLRLLPPGKITPLE